LTPNWSANRCQERIRHGVCSAIASPGVLGLVNEEPGSRTPDRVRPVRPAGPRLPHRTIRSTNDFADDDFRKANPWFTDENFDHNLAPVDKVTAIAVEVDATPAQVAIAWLLAKGDDIAPIPRHQTRCPRRGEHAADRVELTPNQIATLDAMTPPAGDHHKEAQMRMLDC
jgi:hypothetical protein